MALNIDKKVYRNMQEQVAWLTTTVGEIIDVTDAEKLQEYVDQFDIWSATMEDYATTMGGYATTMGGYANTMQGYANTMQGYASQVDTWTNNISAAALSAISGQAITPSSVTADSIIELMSGYSFSKITSANFTASNWYVGVVKTGNKITFVVCCKLEMLNSAGGIKLGNFIIPNTIGQKLIPVPLPNISYILGIEAIAGYSAANVSVPLTARMDKDSNSQLSFQIQGTNALTVNTEYMIRGEFTFLLSDNLAV